jgi:multidrug efflux pump subunit AcrA (membrane-fusion protein)
MCACLFLKSSRLLSSKRLCTRTVRRLLTVSNTEVTALWLAGFAARSSDRTYFAVGWLASKINKIRLGEGHLALIDNQIDQGTGSIRLKAIFPNQDERLWPGEFVNAWLQLDVGHGPVVPDSVVQAGPNGDFAFLVRQDTSIEVRPVRAGAAHDGQTLIEAGLAAGDRVVVDGQYKVRPGVRVISTNAPAAAPAAREKAPAAAPAAREQAAAVTVEGKP